MYVMTGGITEAKKRWAYLALAMLCLLFGGVVYAWSILKVPFAEEFGWQTAALTLNFTLTMCFFCFGGIAGGTLSKRYGTKIALLTAAVLACAGFMSVSFLSGGSIALLYISYGLMGGLGIGISYNVIISTVGAWFHDKKGLSSGCMMMAFGASALVLGNAVSALMNAPAIGWRLAFRVLAAGIGVVLAVSAFVLRRPPEEVKTSPAPESESGGTADFTTREMLRRPSFFRLFIALSFMSAVGNSVIAFARDLALSMNAAAALATTLVGLLSVCNGLGRIITGALFDAVGRRKTTVFVSALNIAAVTALLIAVLASSLEILIAALVLTGLSYGTCPSITSVYAMEFYGVRHFPVNFSVMNFNLMGAALLASGYGVLLSASGGYVVPIAALLVLTLIAAVLNITTRKP